MSYKPIILEVQCIACDKTLQKFEHNPSSFRFEMRPTGGRRMRTPNWSAREKQFLLELIKEYKDAVIPKNETPSRHTQQKTAAWSDIMRRLAAEFGNKFAGSTIKKVKTQWQNMKRVAREEMGARVVSRQSMEVCRILEEQSQLKEEGEAGASPSLAIKQEPADGELPEFSITMDITSDPVTPPLLQQTHGPTLESSLSGSSDYSGNAIESEGEGEEADVDEVDGEYVDPPGDRDRDDTAAATQESSTSGFAEPSTPPPPEVASVPQYARDFDCFATRSLQLKIELMREERHVLRAMRRTAYINRTIAEQQLQHVLWVNQQEQA